MFAMLVRMRFYFEQRVLPTVAKILIYEIYAGIREFKV